MRPVKNTTESERGVKGIFKETSQWYYPDSWRPWDWTMTDADNNERLYRRYVATYSNREWRD